MASRRGYSRSANGDCHHQRIRSSLLLVVCTSGTADATGACCSTDVLAGACCSTAGSLALKTITPRADAGRAGR